MFKVKLEMEGLERWLTSLHYEYFCPVSINENKYRQFLKKNFPYEPSDAYVYQSNKNLPFISQLLPKDIILAIMCILSL
ncbi:hypothetical protein [Saccharicrinis fermentans]|uniref:Uncharacterized protein n=1 Tax=Saccharicrinis fermentans DSM 9555 = JCM 21142 TaxID=869213 RepID=W7XXN6_9BACT|nr:hypothetical protein [Saccharicrinis fermentans]GAF03215.1 hypothetical protein JCM21142_41880 [Saccharicrinis fermentans DSM 9555 = JCM 21142]